MLIQYFQWYGADGDDEFLHNKLRANTFPMLWFPSYADSISVFLGETMDKPKEVKQLVDDKLSIKNNV